MCILELSKVPMYEIHFEWIKILATDRDYYFTDAVCLMYKIKTENVYDDFCKKKVMFDFSNYFALSIYYNDSSTLVVVKMKDKMGGFAINEFAELKLKIYSILVSDSNKHKQAKGVNKNAVAKITNN